MRHLVLVGSKGDVTPSRNDAKRACIECGHRITSGSRTDKVFCSTKCRMAAYRRRKKEAA